MDVYFDILEVTHYIAHHFKGEWAMVTGAPIIVALVVTASALTTWLLMRHQLANKDSTIERQNRDFSSAIQVKDATIETQQHHIAYLSRASLEQTSQTPAIQHTGKHEIEKPADRMAINDPDGLERHQRRIDAAYKDFVVACNKTIWTWQRWDYLAHRSQIQKINDEGALEKYFNPAEPTGREVQDLKRPLLVDIAALRREMVTLAVFLDMPIE